MTGKEGGTLVYGYGNPSRGDDGLGPALAVALEASRLPRTTVVSGHQLRMEDAAELAQYEAVVFVDADASGPEPFRFGRVRAEDGTGFCAHGVTPGLLLALTRELYGEEVPGYLLAIRGYEFDTFRESLSRRARNNLERALGFLIQALVEREFDAYARRHGAAAGGSTATVEREPDGRRS